MRGALLGPEERRALEQQLSRTRDAALYRRLLALLEIDEGNLLVEVARHLRVGRKSLYRWIDRYVAERTIESLEHRSGQGRPSLWTEEIAGIVEQALDKPPFHFGYRANTWTVLLLQSFLARQLPGTTLSASTLRRGLKAKDWVWKRYRYVLAPDPEAEKKTPPFAPNAGVAKLHGAVGRR